MSVTVIGVLSVQGDFAEHVAVLKEIGVHAREVRLPAELNGIDGLIIPGGESTTIARMMDLYNLREPVIRRSKDGMAVWGTCAGLILMAARLEDDRPKPLGLMDIEVARNAFGRQLDSFETDLIVEELGAEPFHAVFIRAPVIRLLRSGVNGLASLKDGRIVAARQGRFLGTAFHPELTKDSRFHKYFVAMCEN